MALDLRVCCDKRTPKATGFRLSVESSSRRDRFHLTLSIFLQNYDKQIHETHNSKFCLALSDPLGALLVGVDIIGEVQRFSALHENNRPSQILPAIAAEAT